MTLRTFLSTTPLSRFVLIEDCLEHEGKDLLESVLRLQTKQNDNVHYFQFEGLFTPRSNFTCYDCVSNCKGWLEPYTDPFLNVAQIKNQPIIVVDSLVHAVHLYGFKVVYNILKELVLNKECARVIAIFHEDLDDNILQYFDHLSTFSIQLQPNSNRVLYVYKKPSGKVIRQIEMYSTNNGILDSEKITVADAKKLVQEVSNPENLATFKIGLNDQEKVLRDKVVLPYVYRDVDEKGGGKITYEFDETDDWDEEDPDDDLDI
ncbi:hypothetical protein PPYR_02945 [Photinus pyralis]|uniref:Elongator complex protein 5 n=1 Tax=Photinus pyralis TaxID=7054 RepID=A0A1Y1N5B5_PHOPY|nr:elongator complex protein 5 [Photinus pyralis]KAB0791145.1 hypothetical protein PPYR_02945 [Photinus pyralis]